MNKISINMTSRPQPLRMEYNKDVSNHTGSLVFSRPIDSDPVHGISLASFISEVGWIQAESRWQGQELKGIELIVNSGGGDLLEALGMYDYIKSLPCPVTARVIGTCGSAATLVVLACSERLISPNGTWYVHMPQGCASGSTREIEETAEYMRTVTNRLVSIYAAETGQGEQAIQAMLENQHWLTADEAVSGGWCTAVDRPVAGGVETPATGIQAFGKRMVAALGIKPRAEDKKDEDDNPSADEPDPDEDDKKEDDDDEVTPAVASALIGNLEVIASQRREIRTLTARLGEKKVQDDAAIEQEVQRRVTAQLAESGVRAGQLPGSGQDKQAGPPAQGTFQNLFSAQTPGELCASVRQFLSARTAKTK